MKIVSSGRGLHSPEFYRKRKRKRRIQVLLLAVGLLAVLSGLIYLSRHQRLLIAEIAVQGGNGADREEITRMVRDLLAGYYLLVIPKTNVFLYPRRVVKESLLEEFPRFKSVDLNLRGFKTLFITVEEREPFALYCRDDCYFLDEEGLIFASAPSFSGAVYFVYTASEALDDQIGRRLMDIEEFKLLSSFLKSLSALHLTPTALEVGSDEYRLFLSTGGEIIWRRESDLLLIRSNLEAFLSNDSIQAQSDFLERILHLDLRTENKVFYKFRN